MYREAHGSTAPIPNPPPLDTDVSLHARPSKEKSSSLPNSGASLPRGLSADRVTLRSSEDSFRIGNLSVCPSLRDISKPRNLFRSVPRAFTASQEVPESKAFLRNIKTKGERGHAPPIALFTVIRVYTYTKARRSSSVS